MGKKLKLIIITFIFSSIILLSNMNVKALNITTDSSKTAGGGYYQVTNTGIFEVFYTDSSSLFKAYKIIDVYYSSSYDSLKYQFTTHFNNYLNSTYCPSRFRICQ